MNICRKLLQKSTSYRSDNPTSARASVTLACAANESDLNRFIQKASVSHII